RHGARRWQRPYPPAGRAGAYPGAPRDVRERGACALRLLARSAVLRRAAARRAGDRPRPPGDAARGCGFGPRRHRVPEDPAGAPSPPADPPRVGGRGIRTLDGRGGRGVRTSAVRPPRMPADPCRNASPLAGARGASSRRTRSGAILIAGIVALASVVVYRNVLH